MRTCLLLLFALAVRVPAQAQSADLVLCDRLAADPSDPDKPADVRGVTEIAASDIATAIKFCKQAASSRRAMYALGRAYAAKGQTAEAIAAWRKAADKGSSAAMVELGVAYGTGAGVARDEGQARKLFEKAAQAGNPRGVSNLAALGTSGGAAPADPAQARALLGKAAETNAEAQYQLGLMLSNGNGGEKDDVAARALFEKAAAQNHPGALERMGAFAEGGRGGPKDRDAAKAYYERAAALGDEDAKRALERIRCPYAIKNKQGQLVTTLCF
jgi:TPR repeat protein